MYMYNNLHVQVLHMSGSGTVVLWRSTVFVFAPPELDCTPHLTKLKGGKYMNSEEYPAREAEQLKPVALAA